MSMTISRRSAMKLGGGALAATALKPWPAFAVDLPRFSGEALGQIAARLSNCTGLMKSSAE